MNGGGVGLPADLPRPGRQNLAVRVTKDAARHIRAGHPWVFDASVMSLRGAGGSGSGAPGDLAVIFDDDRRFMAVGLYDPASPIRIKVVHHGAPATIDRAFWTARLANAVARRAELVASTDTTAYRVVHGENDGLPGLVLDRYEGTAVLKLYSAAWFPHLPDVLASIAETVHPETIVLRLARTVQGAPTFGLRDGMTILGAPPEGPVVFREHGLIMEADVVRGQKTGYFLDQRDNRALVGGMSAGARVLDVFCCTGGFSVHAAAGGATAVHGVDLSAHAVDDARRNMARNRQLPAVAACRHRTTVGDAFEVMGDLARRGERYDLVVVDPPSFASKQADVERAVRAYGRLTASAVSLTRPGGTLVQASCSSRVPADRFVAGVLAAAADAGTQLRIVTTTGHALDHPVGFREGAYLKAVVATVVP